MFKKTDPPVTVVVANGRYDIYGPVTPRSEMLVAALKKMGGIDETVEDGTYHFRVYFAKFWFP